MRKLKKLFIILLIFLTACGKEKISVDTSRPLVAFGDSLTVGYGSKESYTGYLEENLNLEVINLGLNGETTRSGLRRIEKVLEYNPSIVIVELGGKDYLNRVSIGAIEENLQEILSALEDENRVMFLATFYPKSTIMNLSFRSSLKEYDAMYERLVEGKNVYLLNNTWDGVWNKEMSDGTHPNSKGYEIMGKNIIKAMKRKLDGDIFKEK